MDRAKMDLLPRSQEEIDSIVKARLVRALELAGRARFFSEKIKAAGLRPEHASDYQAWRNLPLTTKDELRRMKPEEFYRDLVIATPGQIRDFWRSGGVTGEPLFYPRTKEDMEAGIESFRRTLIMAGIGGGDVAHVSFPLGVHPLGHMYCLALERHGAGLVWAGSGANTPSEVQVKLLFQLQATAWLGMPSYAIHLGHVAHAAGLKIADSRVRRLLTSAELITPARREKIEEMWGVKAYNAYGMSEAGMLGCECERANGFHIWTDMYFFEVLDEKKLEPVSEGEFGQLVVTPLWTNNATPFIRWASGDIAAINRGCSCQGPFSLFPLLKLAGRTTGFFKIRGININHQELEDVLLAPVEISDYRATALIEGERELLRIEVEPAGPTPADKAIAAARMAVERAFGIAPVVVAVPAGTIARELQAQVKPTRIVDRRFAAGEA